MTLSRHIDKYREEESSTEQQHLFCAKQVYLQREVLDNLGSEEFRTLKKIAISELQSNLMIDDEFIMAILDRICLLESELKKLKKK